VPLLGVALRSKWLRTGQSRGCWLRVALRSNSGASQILYNEDDDELDMQST